MSTAFTVGAIGVLAAAVLAALVMRGTTGGTESAGAPEREPELVA
ncbi:hypothetical protein ACFYXS_24875 [Streptomyces sp. NPDC002574]